MDYNTLILTISEIVENDKIEKKGLSLEYTLSESEHSKIQEHLYRQHNNLGPVPYTDIFEVEIAGLLIKLVKKVSEIFANT